MLFLFPSSVRAMEKCNIISGNGLDLGSEIDCVGERFYVIETNDDYLKLLSKYNLYVGNSLDENNNVTPLANPTGKQDASARGYVKGEYPFIGITAFSTTNKGYSGSIVEGYVNNYKTLLESNYRIEVIEARLITEDELTNPETFACVKYGYCPNKYPWIYSTSYWTGSGSGSRMMYVLSYGNFNWSSCNDVDNYGVRPVIVISKSNF